MTTRARALVPDPMKSRPQTLVPDPAPAVVARFGVGFNWYDFFGIGGHYARFRGYPLDAAIYPDLSDGEAWDAILAEIGRWRPGIIRFGIPPDPHLDGSGRFVAGTVHLARLERVARACERMGCEILLDTFCIPERLGFPFPAGSAPDVAGRAGAPDNPDGLLDDACLNMAPRDNDEYARSFVAPLIRHVVHDLGLGAVRWFNPVNEPDHYGVYVVPEGGPDLYRHYVDMYRAMREALDEAGVPRTRLGLVGIDKDIPFDWPVFEYHIRGIDIDPYVDAYAMHSYRHRFDWSMESEACPESDPLSSLADRWVKRLVRHVRERGKPLLAAEIGTFQYGWRRGDPAGPASHEAAILTVETILRMLNAGVEGAMTWSFMNPNSIDGAWRHVRLEGARVAGVEEGPVPAKGIDARPEGARVVREPHSGTAYALLTRHIPAGSAIHPLRPAEREFPHYLHGALVIAPDGHRHLLVVNDHPDRTREMDLPWPGVAPEGLRHVKVLRQGVRESRARVVDGALRARLSPLSFHVFSTEPAD